MRKLALAGVLVLASAAAAPAQQSSEATLVVSAVVEPTCAVQTIASDRGDTTLTMTCTKGTRARARAGSMSVELTGTRPTARVRVSDGPLVHVDF